MAVETFPPPGALLTNASRPEDWPASASPPPRNRAFRFTSNGELPRADPTLPCPRAAPPYDSTIILENGTLTVTSTQPPSPPKTWGIMEGGA